MDSSEDENEGEANVQDKIVGLKVNRDNLNKALNGHYRSIIKEIASDTITIPNDFCLGVSEPKEKDISFMKLVIYDTFIGSSTCSSTC